MKLNLGSGEHAHKDFVNVDMSLGMRPTVCANLIYDLPFKSDAFTEVWMTHCIEHILKRFRTNLFMEVNRVLTSEGRFVLTYPEFREITQRWLNEPDSRLRWERPIYGLHRWPGDSHVCVADSEEISSLLRSCGFQILVCDVESNEEPYNTIMICQKVFDAITRETIFREEVCGTQ